MQYISNAGVSCRDRRILMEESKPNKQDFPKKRNENARLLTTLGLDKNLVADYLNNTPLIELFKESQ